MEKYDVYKDIAERTNGDIYVGVVGPVRTGKSTFITKVMEKVVLPNINNKLSKQIATDEMPQSADGKTVMTTQPKFIPSNAVKIQLKNKTTANVRLVDCVGYMVDGASGHLEDDKPRLVSTPWDDNKITFEQAAEIGTKKVINDYSTIGIVVTTDGSFGEIPRENFIKVEEKVIKELKELKKPFVVVLNSNKPNSKETLKLCDDIEGRYNVSVICKNVSELSVDDVSEIMEKALLEFPMKSFNVDIPKWMQVLPIDHEIISDLLYTIKSQSENVVKMKDFTAIDGLLRDSEYFAPIEVNEIKAGDGAVDFKVNASEGVFYKILSKECGDEINDEYELMSFIKSFATEKREYVKIKNALKSAIDNGYGMVFPSIDEMNLEEPVLVKQGGRYGVKLRASAPSLHIMKVDVKTEVAPIVGSEKQGKDLVDYLMGQFEENPASIWETDMFGKSLHDLVNEGLQSKLSSVPVDAQVKVRKTMTKIVNENRGGLICILL